jgi:hypothetical protein
MGPMTAARWAACEDPERMLAYLRRTQRYRVTDRKLRLFLVACCRRIWDHLPDERSRNAVDIAERFADGLVGQKVRGKARSAAKALAREFEVVGGFRGAQAAATAAWFAVEKTIRRASGQVAAAAAGYASYAGNPLPSGPAWVHDFPRAVVPEKRAQAALLRCIVGNPFLPAVADPAWLQWNDGTIPKLARAVYEGRAFDRLPVLADALEEAGCTEQRILHHCRGPGAHTRGCWVLDHLLGKS